MSESHTLSYYPSIYTGRGPAYTAMAIARAMFIQDANVKFVSAWSKSKTTDYIPSWAGGNMKLPFRLIKRSGLLKLGMSRAQDYILREIDYQKEKVVLQIWPDVTPQFIKSAQSAGAIVAREMINTHVSVARKILEDESARLGLSPQHKIDSRLRTHCLPSQKITTAAMTMAEKKVWAHRS